MAIGSTVSYGRVKIPNEPKTTDIENFQTAVERNFKEYNDRPWLQSLLVENVTIGTAATRVEHRLGKAYRGWRVIDKQADARVWRDTTATEDTSRYLVLLASASVVISLEVF
jgi:hypothetical protein